MSRFLNYSVASSTRVPGRYVVTAEYQEGYEVLSYHPTKEEADRAMRRYERKKFWAHPMKIPKKNVKKKN